MNQIIAKSNTKYVDRDVLKTLARSSDNQASHNAAKEVPLVRLICLRDILPDT